MAESLIDLRESKSNRVKPFMKMKYQTRYNQRQPGMEEVKPTAACGTPLEQSQWNLGTYSAR